MSSSMGPLPKSKLGHVYTLVMQDYFTKWSSHQKYKPSHEHQRDKTPSVVFIGFGITLLFSGEGMFHIQPLKLFTFTISEVQCRAKKLGEA